MRYAVLDEIQTSMADQNTHVPQDQAIEFRIGIHVGDIIFDDNDIFGDGVNVAARVEKSASRVEFASPATLSNRLEAKPTSRSMI